MVARTNAIKQFKQMYTQISVQIEQLCKCQSELLKKIGSDVHHQSNRNYNLVDQCREHVKSHNYKNSFRYPIVFHDLSKLLVLHPNPECQSFSEEFIIKTGCDSASGDIVQNEEPFAYAYQPESLSIPSSADPLDAMSPNSIKISETFLSKQKIEYENEIDDDLEYDINIDDDNDNNDQDDSPEEEHSKTYQPPPKKTQKFQEHYICNWPSCKQTFSKSFHFKAHLDKHKKTPRLKCEKCGKSFYYKSGLLSHQKSISCQLNQQKAVNVSNRFGPLAPNPTTNLTLQNQQDKSILPNRDYIAFENPIVQNSKLPPNALLPLQQLVSTLVPSTSTRSVPNYVVQNTGSFNYNQYDPSGKVASSSRSSSTSASYPATPDEMIKNQQKELDEEEDINSEHSSDEESSSDSEYQPQRQKTKPPVQINIIHDRTSALKSMQSTDEWDGTGRNPNFIKYDLSPNPITGKYPCLDPSCSKSSKSVKYIRRHYEQDHLKVRKKESFSCGWPGCGKIIGDKKTYQFHMDKHRGNPQNACEVCGAKFYWSRGLIRHKIKVHGEKRRKY